MFLKKEGDPGGMSTYWQPSILLRALMSKGLQKLYPETADKKRDCIHINYF